MSLIRTSQLTKTYKNGDQTFSALDQIDLEVKKGEIIALTGPSGSGKTTLMHLLGCLDTPSSGEYFIEGEEVSKRSPKELALIRNQKIGFVFQNFYLLDDLSAIENVVLPQLYGGIIEKVARKRASELLEMVGLGDRLKNYPNQLSGGQKQRVAVARALAMDPPILLADEPTGNLDSENAKKMIDLFHEINRIKQTTIILVTHEKGISERAQRCVTIRDGHIVSDKF